MSVSRTIFLADDDQDDRLFLREALSAIDPTISIVEAMDGIDLLSILETGNLSPPCLFVLDMNMPRMNGLETVLKIKANTAYAHIPAVMISTSSDRWLIDQALLAGISYFATKPSNLEGFTDLAKDLCNSIATK